MQPLWVPFKRDRCESCALDRLRGIRDNAGFVGLWRLQAKSKEGVRFLLGDVIPPVHGGFTAHHLPLLVGYLHFINTHGG